MQISLTKRILLAIPTLIAIAFLTFVMGYLAPGDPVEVMLGEKATPEAVARVRHSLGLDQPPITRFGIYLASAARGDFGTSYYNRRPVGEIIAQGFPVTAGLATAAMALSLLVGIPLGMAAALKQNSGLDRICMGTALAGVSVPTFVLGPVLIIIFALRLRVLPVAGWGHPANYVLPTLVLAARPTALLARHTRSSMLEVIRQDYIRAAYARGLSDFQVVVKHGLRNAILPVLTVTGTLFGYLLSGSFVVETVFAVPGIGYKSLASIAQRDYPVIQAVTLLMAVIFVLVNLAVDVLYAWADPRVRRSA
jgi:peptide/nickel transport system permease protein